MNGRAIAGTGSVFETTNGGKPCWCASWSMTDSSGKRVFVRGYGSTQLEAIRRRQANLQKRLAKGAIERTPRCPSISAYMTIWLETISQDKQNDTSRARNRRNLEAHVLPHLDKPLTSVTVEDVERLFHKTLPALNVTTSSRYNAYASLRALFNYARKRKVIPTDFDPLKEVEVKKPLPAVRDNDDLYVDKRLSVSKYMLRWLSDPTNDLHHLYPRVLLMYLGLRRAELLGLTWDCVKNIDKANQAYLLIRQQLIYDESGEKRGWYIEARTKTKETRVVPLPEDFRRALEALKKEGATAEEEWAKDLVFLNSKGHHITYNDHNRDWRKVLHGYYNKDGKHPQPLDETEYFRPHAARRLCVSLLAEAGVPFETAKDILGHKTVSMTDYYHSVTKQARREAATLLGEAITVKTKPRKTAVSKANS